MKVLLIAPIIIGPWGNYCPPIGLGYIKAVLKKQGIEEVKIVDLTNSTFDNYKRILVKENPDIVGISCFTESRINTFKMLRIAKELNHNIITIVGGIHASLMFEQILLNYSYVDIVCLGEGDYILANLINNLKMKKELCSVKNIAFLKNGQVVKTGDIYQVEDLDSLPMPDFEDLDLKMYQGGYYFEKNQPRASIITSRGCPFRCTYCASKQAFGRWRYRSPDKVVHEIEWYVTKGFENFSFVDDLFTLNEDRVMKICQGIIDRKLSIKWFAQTRADCLGSTEMLKVMKASGCKLLQFGAESGSEEMLRFYNKKEKLEDFYRAFGLCDKVGIDTQMMLIIGGDGESKKTIEESKKIILRTKPKILMVSNLRVFPKTKLMDIAVEKGLYTDDIWLTDSSFFYYTGHISEVEMNRYHRDLMFHFAKQRGIKGYWWLLKRLIEGFSKEPVKYFKILINKPFN